MKLTNTFQVKEFFLNSSPEGNAYDIELDLVRVFAKDDSNFPHIRAATLNLTYPNTGHVIISGTKRDRYRITIERIDE